MDKWKLNDVGEDACELNVALEKNKRMKKIQSISVDHVTIDILYLFLKVIFICHFETFYVLFLENLSICDITT